MIDNLQRSETPIDELRIDLLSKDRDKRLSVLTFIVDFAEDAELLLDELDDLIARFEIDADERPLIARALAAAKRTSGIVLRKWLTSSSRLGILCSLEAIGIIGAKHPYDGRAYVKEIIPHIVSEDDFIANCALEALANIGILAGEAIKPVIGVIESNRKTVTTTAICTLGRIGRADVGESIALLRRELQYCAKHIDSAPILTVLGAISDIKVEDRAIIDELSQLIVLKTDNPKKIEPIQYMAISAIVNSISRHRDAIDLLQLLKCRSTDSAIQSRIQNAIGYLRELPDAV